MEREISILSGGDLVALNGFVKKMFLSTLLGMLSSLHDVDVDREVRIIVSAAERQPAKS
jgi:hypothetical protein